VTLYYRHQASLEHDTGAHPENAERIRRLESELDETGWRGLVRRKPPRAEREQLTRVHDPEHVDAIERFCESGGGMIDLDTVASAASWEAALRGAGAAADAARRLLAGEASAAFCGLRPPGHHAERGRAMGFCLLNNAAVAAGEALALGAERVLVLDWDVHHGNGTEEIFRADADVLYASIHQAPLYPGTGPAEYEGEGAGVGYTLNLPVPAGTGSETFVSLVEHVVAPVARAYQPGLIVISAGYDAHRADPLASCMLDEDAYLQMSRAMAAAGRELGAPVLVCLEGGYDPDALAASVLATIEGLADGSDPAPADSRLSAGHRVRVAERWGLTAAR
jgi:acetoin utilization deacetylase AcuC-like enzyme